MVDLLLECRRFTFEVALDLSTMIEASFEIY